MPDDEKLPDARQNDRVRLRPCRSPGQWQQMEWREFRLVRDLSGGAKIDTATRKAIGNYLNKRPATVWRNGQMRIAIDDEMAKWPAKAERSVRRNGVRMQ